VANDFSPGLHDDALGIEPFPNPTLTWRSALSARCGLVFRGRIIGKLNNALTLCIVTASESYLPAWRNGFLFCFQYEILVEFAEIEDRLLNYTNSIVVLLSSLSKIY